MKNVALGRHLAWGWDVLVKSAALFCRNLTGRALRLGGCKTTESKRSRRRWVFFSTRSSREGHEEKGIHGLKFSTWNQSSTSIVKRMEDMLLVSGYWLKGFNYLTAEIAEDAERQTCLTDKCKKFGVGFYFFPNGI